MKLTKLIRMKEGLITSVSPETFKEKMSNGKPYPLTVYSDPRRFEDNDNVYLVEFEDTEVDIPEGIIDGIPLDEFKRRLKKVNKKAAVMGWYLSAMDATCKIETKYNPRGWNFEEVFVKSIDELPDKTFEVVPSLLYEPKFQKREIPKEKLGTTLFHATDKKYIEKIKKKGLIPRSARKHTNHPDRIYFTKTYDAIKSLIFGRFKKFIEGPMVIVQVDVNKLPDDFVAYEDPNYKNGFFTSQNIPPNAIEKIIKVTDD